MLFSSLTFLIFFLPVVVIANGLVPVRCKNAVLLAASLVFYGWGEPRYLPLFIGVAVANWGLGLALGAQNGKGVRRALLALSIALNMGLLAVYKYTGLIAGTFGLTGVLAPALPLGISFFTFQSVAYQVDLYRRQIEPERNLIDYATFILMFPQLIAGPIIRYQDVREALHGRRVTGADLERGMTLLIVGLSAKVLLANPCGQVFARVTAAQSPSAALYWVGAAAYGLQIYFDFAGYSIMAVGLGRMLGFRFARNFMHPYASSSVGEFWRRWHITLGQWFRDYVYIPLGGSRRGAARTCLNLLIVWMLTGLWHGASWNFALWGLYYGVLLILERTPPGAFLKKHTALGRVVTLLCVLVGWVIFAFDDMGALGAYLSRMCSLTAGTDALWTLRTEPVVLCAAVLLCVPAVSVKADALIRRSAAVRVAGMLVLLALCVLSLTADAYNPFLYFRF